VAADFSDDVLSPEQKAAMRVFVTEERRLAGLPRPARRVPAIAAGLALYLVVLVMMPAEVLVSEVPTNLPPGARTGHQRPSRLDPTTYKVVFTRAHFGAASQVDGADILRRAVNKEPVVEVWVNRPTGEVVRVLGPPAEAFYEGMPVPVF
jgi:hypothetical protein